MQCLLFTHTEERGIIELFPQRAATDADHPGKLILAVIHQDKLLGNDSLKLANLHLLLCEFQLGHMGTSFRCHIVPGSYGRIIDGPL